MSLGTALFLLVIMSRLCSPVKGMHRFCRLFRKGAIDPFALRPLQRFANFIDKKSRPHESLHQTDVFLKSFMEHVHSSTRRGAKTILLDYCGDESDVAPFTMLFMRLLCDMSRFEDMRKMFSLFVSEMGAVSVELFSIYLIGMCKSDDFDETDLKEVADLANGQELHLDALCQVCIMELSLRLGKDPSSNWKKLQKEYGVHLERAPVEASFCRKLRDLSFAIQKSHYDPNLLPCMVSFLTAHGACDGKRLLSILIALSNNSAATPDSMRKIIKMLDTKWNDIAATDRQHGSKNDPVSEATALKLLVNCLRWKDVESAEALQSFFERRGVLRESSKKHVDRMLLYMHAGHRNIEKALDIMENIGVQEVQMPDASRPFIVDALNFVVAAMHPVLHFLTVALRHQADVDRAYLHLARRHKERKLVTTATLDLVVVAYAKLHDFARAADVFESYKAFGVEPKGISFACFFKAAGGSVEQQQVILSKMVSAKVEPETHALASMITECVGAGNCSGASMLLPYLEKPSSSIPAEHVQQLQSIFSSVCDLDAADRVAQLLKRRHPS